MLYQGVTFELIGDPKIAASAIDLEQLVKRKGLMIIMDGQVFGLMLSYRHGDHALVRSIESNKCVIRVDINRQQIFDIRISMNVNRIISIDNFKEIPRRSSWMDRRRESNGL